MKRTELLKKSLFIFIVRIIGAALTLISTILYAKLLGPDKFGIFSLSLTIITIISVFIRSGLDNVVLKQVAANLSSNKKKSDAYVATSIFWVLLFGIFISIFLWIYSEFISNNIFNKPSLAPALKYFSLLLVPLSLVFIMASAYKAYNKPVLSTIIQTVFIPTLTLIIILLIYFFNKISITNIVLSTSFSFLFGLLFFIIYWLLNITKEYIHMLNIRSLLKEGIPMLLISSGALIMAWSDIIILGLFSDSKIVGIYSAASRVVMATTIILISINAITAPKYASYYKNNDIKKISNLAHISFFILFISVIIPGSIIIFFPEFVMSLFGEKYIEIGSKFLVILIIGQLVNVSSGSVGYLLSMTGNEKVFRNIILFTATLNIILSIIGAKIFGYIAVAYSTAFSVILWNVLAIIAVKKHLGFWTINLNIYKTIKGA